MAVSQLDLSKFIKDWIEKVLNTDAGLSIAVIQGKQNAPSPATPYITIDYPMGKTKIGRAHLTETTAASEEFTTISNYEATIRLQEIGGPGDLLLMLSESLEKQTIKEFWENRNYGFMREDEIIDVSELIDDTNWLIRASLDLYISYTYTQTDNAGYFNTIEYEGTYNEPE